jgi:hypothetical protein
MSTTQKTHSRGHRIADFSTLCLFVGAFFLLSIYSSPLSHAATLSRSLSIGDEGEDVRLLQQLLNADKRTAVAATGPGSAGLETTRFGELTKRAVIRYQELYRTEVLTPAGLAKGTGFVGPLTLKKLQKSAQGLSGSRTGGENALVLFSLSPTRVSANTPVVLRGVRFGTGPLTVSVGSVRVPATASSADEDDASFVVPSSLSSGLHEVVLHTSAGDSNPLKVRFEGETSKSSRADLSINQLSPSRGGYGATVTILGKGFTFTGNTVVIGFHTIEGLSSPDGTTLTFTVPRDLTGLVFDREVLTGLSPEVPLGVIVKNAAGETEPSTFVFTFYNQ